MTSSSRAVRLLAPATALLIGTGLLAGCGGGRIVCDSTPVTDIGNRAVTGPLPLGPGAGPAPAGWVPRSRGGLTVVAPPPMAQRFQIEVDQPEADGSTCTTWNGAQIGDSADEMGVLNAKPAAGLAAEVDVPAQRFSSFPLPGAEAAAARIVDEPYVDGGGTPVAGQRATTLEAVVAAHGTVYRVTYVTAPGPAGQLAARQVLASLRLA